FAANTATQTVEVLVTGDLVNETNETFFLNLVNAANATIVDSQAVCVITNNDPLPFLTVSSTTLMEGDRGSTNAVFQVSLSGARERTVSVRYATSNGTATAGSDYVAQSGILS